MCGWKSIPVASRLGAPRQNLAARPTPTPRLQHGPRACPPPRVAPCESPPTQAVEGPRAHSHRPLAAPSAPPIARVVDARPSSATTRFVQGPRPPSPTPFPRAVPLLGLPIARAAAAAPAGQAFLRAAAAPEALLHALPEKHPRTPARCPAPPTPAGDARAFPSDSRAQSTQEHPPAPPARRDGRTIRVRETHLVPTPREPCGDVLIHRPTPQRALSLQPRVGANAANQAAVSRATEKSFTTTSCHACPMFCSRSRSPHIRSTVAASASRCRGGHVQP